MCKIDRIVMAIVLVVVVACVQSVRAEEQETVVKRVWLPFASLETEVTYYPSKKVYEKLRDDTLARLRACDPTAFFNPAEGPWKHAETTAEVGIDVRGVGASTGRKLVREIPAAEDALEMFEKEGGRCPNEARRGTRW